MSKALTNAYEELNAVFENCIERDLNPEQEFKSRIDKLIASLDPSDFGVLFILVSEFCFQRNREPSQEVPVLDKNEPCVKIGATSAIDELSPLLWKEDQSQPQELNCNEDR